MKPHKVIEAQSEGIDCRTRLLNSTGSWPSYRTRHPVILTPFHILSMVCFSKLPCEINTLDMRNIPIGISGSKKNQPKQQCWFYCKVYRKKIRHFLFPPESFIVWQTANQHAAGGITHCLFIAPQNHGKHRGSG